MTGRLLKALARLIQVVTIIVVLVIVLAIILRILSGNPHNAIVSDIHDAGQWLVGPFKNVFSVKGAKLNLAVNWGLAAVVYALLGVLIATLVTRISASGRFGRTRPVA